jgi:hypothetical protein
MGKTYNEDEFRNCLASKAEQIAQGVVGRLRDDNYFKIHHVEWSGILRIDGEVITSWDSFRKLFADDVKLLIPELLSEITVALFDEVSN